MLSSIFLEVKNNRTTKNTSAPLPSGTLGKLNEEARVTNADERDKGAIRRFDEVNLSQHSLISVKERVTDADLNWTVTYSLNGRDYNVSCRGLPDYGSPHGIDTDVSAAIINLFIELGCPDDDTISVTAYQLLKSAGLHINGQNYTNLRLSLMRLEGTQYVISRTWRDAKRGRWTSSTFRYLDKVAFTGKAAEEVDEQSLIRVTLPRDVTASIRAGYLKPLHLPFMQSLKRPPTRALYRLLDAQRIDPEHPERRIGAFEVKLMDWAQACKLNSDRPDMIRRALAPAHKELIDRGVLTSVEYTGRGQKQTVKYVFGEVAAPPDPRIVAALMQGGVTRPVSEKLAREFSADVIEEAVALHAALLKDGYKARSKGGLLVDVVRNPGKYQATVSYRGPQDAAALQEEAERTRRREEQATQLRLQEDREALDAAPPEQRAEATFKMILMYVRKALSLTELDILQRAILDGTLNGQEVLGNLSTAAARQRLAEVIGELRLTIQQL